MCAGWLQRRACAVEEPDPTASRGRVLRLTPKGGRAQQAAIRVVGSTEASMADAIRVRSGNGARNRTRAGCRRRILCRLALAPGLIPYDDNWRAALGRPETLPCHPMVLNRGGYPDGS